VFEGVERVREVTKSLAEGVMTTLTSEPKDLNNLTIRGVL
jgi:hypothetical protein